MSSKHLRCQGDTPEGQEDIPVETTVNQICVLFGHIFDENACGVMWDKKPRKCDHNYSWMITRWSTSSINKIQQLAATTQTWYWPGMEQPRTSFVTKAASVVLRSVGELRVSF